MHSTRPAYATLFFLLLTLFAASIIARAADNDADEPEDYDVKARVLRISLMNGQVSIKRNGKTDWERASLNYPLVEGDTLSTEGDSRVEIQIDARNFLRLGANSILKIVTLRNEGVALSVVEGTASVRLARFDQQKEFFEIDAPKTTMAAEKNGLYRIDVGKDGSVRLTARDGGRARIYSEKSGFALRDGHTAELIVDGPDAGEWEMLTASQRDTWDEWVDDRERYLVQRMRYDTKYYDDQVWGGEDLEAYGSWIHTGEYGWIWRPHPTAINTYVNWAPYRYGQWAWFPPYGWTWIGSEPWGWAPYHYGRWVYYNNYWAWSPRSQYYRNRSWWRPALVAFVSINLSFGDQICWYPLSYHHRDPRSRNYNGRNSQRHGDRDDRRGHRDWRGVTGISRREFGDRNPRPRPADERWGPRVVDAEPLPDVPVRPAGETEDTPSGNRRGRWTVARRERIPRVDLPDRPTGASERSPGVPLDTTLRRTRVWNGREPRAGFPVPTGSATGVDTRPTGVVSRPSSPAVETPPTGNDARGVNPIPERSERPARGNRRVSPQSVPTQSGSGTPETAPTGVPITTPANEERRPADRPARPERYERPPAGERPAGVERNEEAFPRSAPAERRSQPAPRQEAPAQSERPTRNERPPRNDPPPQHSQPVREEQPQRSEPAPRNDPPPRNPPPRDDPPARNDPPPRDNPPARNDPPPKNDPPPSRGESDRPSPRNRDPR